MSYLPLAHIAERMYSIYGATAGGGHVYFCHDAAALAAATAVVRPTGFFGVPRIWEKIQAAIKAGLAAEQDPARRAAVERRPGDRPPLHRGHATGPFGACRPGRGVPAGR